MIKCAVVLFSEKLRGEPMEGARN